VFAHNDLVLGNVIYNQDDGSIAFIDYEYATYNYQGFDIANHFNEYVGEYSSFSYIYPTISLVGAICFTMVFITIKILQLNL
jgi:ethanolamine kinase